MSLTDTQRDAFAHALYEADQSQSQIPIISQDHPGLDLEDAYAIQSALVQRFVQAGRVIKGWKIGLTSKAMQYALNIDIPDSGVLFEDMFFENCGDVPTSRFIATRIEAEICFIMKADLSGPNVTREDVIAATDSVCPSLEILDTRIIPKDPQTGAIRKVTDTISDNAANAGIVLGDERHAIDDFDLRWVGAICSRDGEVEETGLGAGVLDDPIMGIVWLANRLAAYGDKISAGDVVLSGSFIRPVQAPKGCEISADFGPFGSVSCRFV
ncbi:MAG: 2-oxo-hepta-3-ene-1,7-dioic acid hydratase [Alphaproteobacteria bacterium]|nr:2-oxo-hepta-3-ene-1,7-dioic acid hydratase [Alphaproteobacteria bacterium]